MKNTLTIIATLSLTLFLLNCQTSKTNISSILGNRFPSSAKFSPADLTNTEKDAEFLEFMASLDLENSTVSKTVENIGKYFFSYKSSSTSVGIKVERLELEDGTVDGKKVGKWVPTNSANDVESQVVAFNLSRFLNMSQLVVPSAYYHLGPKALALFKPMLKCEIEKGQHKDNCLKIRKELEDKKPASMIGSYVGHVKDEKEVPNMNTFKGKYATNGKLNPNHPIAKFIKSSNPMPSPEKKMDLGIVFEKGKNKSYKAQETELELARQFSKIMVLDILTGQWDRFSGGNIEAIYNPSKDAVQFMAIDNGGASMKGDAKLLYWEAVTRFDKAQIDRVQDLLTLLKEDPEGTQAGLALLSSSKSLAARCQKLLDHVADQVKTQGPALTFFPQ